ncbi:MAG: molecular chaperone DnaJ [Methanosarcinales archaeon Met12]|nr:MAG: molecular chaperone DnaJ [Methanosarcinales archaeon Met12]
MEKNDYYEVLGISKNASQEEIKRAFKQLARKHHPDIAGKDNEEKFKKINEAFQVLSDPQKRAQYDRFGHTAFRPEDFADFRGFNFADLFRDSGLGDIFDAFSGFSRRSGRSRARRGADLRYDMEITLEDAFSGTTKKIDVPVFVACETCGGTGAKPGFLKECPECNGTGEIKRVQRSVFGQMVNIATCGNCGGYGKVIEKACDSCRGNGRVKKIKKVEIKIPKGVDNNQYLRIAGQGESGYNGGAPGDLYVTIHIKPHKIFERRGSDLLSESTINLAQAIFGDEIEVTTMSTKAKIKVPAGTQSHTVFRLGGQGMPDLHIHRRGDQLVKVVVKIPEKLSKRQKELLKEFVKEGGEEVKRDKGLIDMVKDFI